MSRTRLQSSSEPKLQPRAAASQSQTSAHRFEKVPASGSGSCGTAALGCGRGRCGTAALGCGRSLATRHSPLATAVDPHLDRLIRSAIARKQGPRLISRSLHLFERYGIRVGAIRRYARQLRSARALPADGSEDRALCMHVPLTAMPYPTLRPSGHTLESATAPSVSVPVVPGSSQRPPRLRGEIAASQDSSLAPRPSPLTQDSALRTQDFMPKSTPRPRGAPSP